MSILYRDICKILAFFLFGFMIALCIPFTIACYYQFIANPEAHPQPHTTLPFFYTILITFAVSALCYWNGRKSTGQLFRKEGLLTVALIWYLTPALGALPFYFSGTLSNPFQAYFESTSGLTTTGATTMTAKKFDPKTGEEIPIVKEYTGVNPKVYVFYGNIDPIRDLVTGQILHEGIEAVSKALLFWRSFMQWLGGVGIVVLFAAILPVLGVGGKMLFQAEVTGPVKESLTPRLKETAINLWKIYVGLTLIEIILLKLVNPSLSVMELVTVTFSTISTGGFTMKNASIGTFQSPAMEWVVMVFMFLGSISFTYYFYALRGKFYRVYEPEFLLYIIILGSSCIFAAWMLVGQTKVLLATGKEGVFSVPEAIRYGFFQVITAQTSTGFVTADYDTWPSPVQEVMLIVMFLGGMAGSTAGGMKIMRYYMLFRIAQNKVESLFRPEEVRRFRVGGKEVDTGAAITVLCYFLIVIALAVLTTVFFTFDGIDVETAIGLTACFVNNTGIGFRMDGPTGSCAFLSNEALALSTLIMVLGRLEFFAILSVLVPAFWRKD